MPARTALSVGVFVFAALTLAAPWAAHAAEPLELNFGSLFQHPIGPRGLEISDSLRAAEGQRVRLVGYMVAQEQPAAGRFLLTPRPVRLSEHADGDADDLPPTTVTVLLAPSQHERSIPHHPGLIALTGRLELGRAEDATGRVSWLRLQLDPDALSSDAQPTP
jgi:hypothetical protein